MVPKDKSKKPGPYTAFTVVYEAPLDPVDLPADKPSAPHTCAALGAGGAWTGVSTEVPEWQAIAVSARARAVAFRTRIGTVY